MKPRVFVTMELPVPTGRQAGDATSPLREVADVEVWPQEEPPSHAELVRRVADADAILTMLTDRIDAAVLDAGRRLRIVAQMAVGYDNIDVAAATERGVLVTNTPGVLTDATADLAFALLLAAARRVVEGDRLTRTGGWKSWHPSFLLGQEVHGATLGIVGFGAIGQAMARRARGFEMRILYHSRTRRVEAGAALGAEYAELDRLLRESDFVSLHVPLTPETRRLIGERELALMKPTAVLVNAARGAVVDQRALYVALNDHRIAAAGLDVAETEPIPPDEPLLALDNVVITPHIGSAGVATRRKMAEMAVESVMQALRGETPSHCVNPEALSRRKR